MAIAVVDRLEAGNNKHLELEAPAKQLSKIVIASFSEISVVFSDEQVCLFNNNQKAGEFIALVFSKIAIFVSIPQAITTIESHALYLLFAVHKIVYHYLATIPFMPKTRDMEFALGIHEIRGPFS